MKLRLRGQSIRLRLTRSEVAQLAQAGLVEETIQIGPKANAQLVYRLQLSTEHSRMTADFQDRQITVFLPADLGRRWSLDDTVGLYGEEPWGLRLAVEKDFKCLEVRPHEDDSDAYEHPGGVAGLGCGIAND
jgi:hypothetical protein